MVGKNLKTYVTFENFSHFSLNMFFEELHLFLGEFHFSPWGAYLVPWGNLLGTNI
jgi:hypothetical protein